MIQRDKEFKEGTTHISPELTRSSSQTGPSPAVPVRQYENNEFAGTGLAKAKPDAKYPKPIAAGAHSRATLKPVTAPKPSIRKPGDRAKDPSVNASQINMLIGQNKGVITAEADDPYNTYSVMGNEAQSENSAAYSEVYIKKAATAAAYTDSDDPYDVVHTETTG